MKFLRCFIALIIFLILLMGGIVFVKIDAILHHAINVHGSELLGVDVSAEKISLNIMKGNLEVMGIAVKNPKGFSGVDALYVPKLTIRSKVPNLFRNPVIIEKIMVQSPVVNFEIGNKDNNITILKQSVIKDGNAQKAAEPSASNGLGVIIKNVTVENMKLNADLKLLKKTVDLGDISIDGIKNDKPVPYQELMQQLLDQILVKISTKSPININIGGVKVDY